jgi:hypothetical protein
LKAVKQSAGIRLTLLIVLAAAFFRPGTTDTDEVRVVEPPALICELSLFFSKKP